MGEWSKDLVGEKVSPEMVLDQKERRVFRRQELLKSNPRALICFTLNIPGEIKNFPLSEYAFSEGRKAIVSRLSQIGNRSFAESVYSSCLGMEAFYVVDEEPTRLKKNMECLEERDDFTRLFDIDVFDGNGAKISRNKPRKCFVCDDPAYICAGRQVHSAIEIETRVMSALRQQFNEDFAGKVSSAAVKALMYEAAVTPKPGLVDRNHNGAHADMNYFTFMDSIAALGYYFYKFALFGAGFSGSAEELIKRVREIGKEAEIEMFKATGNANTHKGAIFSLGLLCAAAGFLTYKEKKPSLAAISDMSAVLAKPIVIRDLEFNSNEIHTSGEEQYLIYGLKGCRGEAASGFQSVTGIGLPALENALSNGFSLNMAGVYALLALLSEVNDSNVIRRSSLPQQNLIHEKLKQALKGVQGSEAAVLRLAKEMDTFFIERNISPGGCADLLAVSFFFYFYRKL